MKTIYPAEPPILTDTDIGALYLQAVSKEDGLSPLKSERIIVSHLQLQKELKARETELEQLRNLVRPLSDRVEMADTYEQWLLNIGKSVGCEHIDEQLQNCVIRVVQGEDEEKLTLITQRSELLEALKDLAETASDSSWGHVTNGPCSCKSCSIDKSRALIAKLEGPQE